MKKVDLTVLKIDNSNICYIVVFYDGLGVTTFTFKDYSSAFDFFKHYLNKEIN